MIDISRETLDALVERGLCTKWGDTYFVHPHHREDLTPNAETQALYARCHGKANTGTDCGDAGLSEPRKPMTAKEFCDAFQEGIDQAEAEAVGEPSPFAKWFPPKTAEEREEAIQAAKTFREFVEAIDSSPTQPLPPTPKSYWR